MAKTGKPPGKAKGTKGLPAQETSKNLESEETVPLNFKVSTSFKREFKTYATQHDMSMRDLLEKTFYEYKGS